MQLQSRTWIRVTFPSKLWNNGGNFKEVCDFVELHHRGPHIKLEDEWKTILPVVNFKNTQSSGTRSETERYLEIARNSKILGARSDVPLIPNSLGRPTADPVIFRLQTSHQMTGYINQKSLKLLINNKSIPRQHLIWFRELYSAIFTIMHWQKVSVLNSIQTLAKLVMCKAFSLGFLRYHTQSPEGILL